MAYRVRFSTDAEYDQDDDSNTFDASDSTVETTGKSSQPDVPVVTVIRSEDLEGDDVQEAIKKVEEAKKVVLASNNAALIAIQNQLDITNAMWIAQQGKVRS